MVSLELETGHVATAGDGRGELVPREGAQDGGLSRGPILDDQEVKLRLHVDVIEGQVDAALGPGEDEPDTVEVVAVVLRVAGRQDGPGGAGEVEEAGDCKRRAVEVRESPWSCARATERRQGARPWSNSNREQRWPEGWAGLAGLRALAGDGLGSTLRAVLGRVPLARCGQGGVGLLLAFWPLR